MEIKVDKQIKHYLDHAATTHTRSEVFKAMEPYFKNDFGNPSSIYSFGTRAKASMEAFRESIAASLNANPREIYFVSGGTEGDNWAIRGSAYDNISKGRHLITSAIEHHAVLHTFQALEKEGFEVTYVGVDEDGLVNPEDIRAAIKEDTTFVSIMMANNEIGTIQPIKEISQICSEKNLIFHTDAVQAAGSVKIDVKDLGVSILNLSAHKIYGPKGIGCVYIKRGTRIKPLMYGGAQEMRMRPGTESLPLIAGLAKAIELANMDIELRSSELLSMREEIIEKIFSTIPYARLNGSRASRLPGNINISFEFIEGEALLLLLDHYGYLCSSGSACTSGSLDPSHVLLAIGLPHEIAHGSLRISLGKDTKRDFIDKFVNDLCTVVKRLRDMSPLYSDFLAGKITQASCMLTGDSSYCKAEAGCYRDKDNLGQ